MGWFVEDAETILHRGGKGNAEIAKGTGWDRIVPAPAINEIEFLLFRSRHYRREMYNCRFTAFPNFPSLLP